MNDVIAIGLSSVLIYAGLYLLHLDLVKILSELKELRGEVAYLGTIEDDEEEGEGEGEGV